MGDTGKTSIKDWVETCKTFWVQRLRLLHATSWFSTLFPQKLNAEDNELMSYGCGLRRKTLPVLTRRLQVKGQEGSACEIH